MGIKGVSARDAEMTFASENYGTLGDKKAAQWKQPIVSVLILLGVAGIGVVAVGIATYGGQQAWWSSGALSSLDQIDAIILMGTGGGAAFIGLVTTAVAAYESRQGPLTLETLQSLSVEEKSKCRHNLYKCTLSFAKDARREVYLYDHEIGNLQESAPQKFKNKTTNEIWTTSRLKGLQSQDILQNLDTHIRERTEAR